MDTQDLNARSGVSSGFQSPTFTRSKGDELFLKAAIYSGKLLWRENRVSALTLDDSFPFWRVEVVVQVEAVEGLAVGRGGGAPAVIGLQVRRDGRVGRPPVQICPTGQVRSGRAKIRFNIAP